MSEYLDKTGLTHLWSKLKEKLNTMTAEPYKSGVNCVAGKYYTFNNKLYLCTKNTDGTIPVTNTTYFNNTTVGNEISLATKRIDYLGTARIKMRQALVANQYGYAEIPMITGYIPTIIIGAENTGIFFSGTKYVTRIIKTNDSGVFTYYPGSFECDVIYEKI